MYLDYFGLVEKPFSIAPDPHYLYMSVRHQEAMAHLSYGLSQGGCFIVLTGEVGTGKTTLCRNLLTDLPDNVDVALVLNPNINEQELMQTVCDELKITYSKRDSQKQLLDKLNRHLLDAYAANRNTVLIIDEAQLLSRDVLEYIRLLTNLETTKAKLLQIMLIGQPELNTLLSRDDLRQLAQRVTARYHLPALQSREIGDYINFRLAVAGCKKPLFSAQALRALYKLSDGIPRKINVLADHTLLAVYAKSQSVVDTKTVKQAASEVFISDQDAKLDTSIKPWWLAVVALLLLNLGLWWWFVSSHSQTAPQVVAMAPDPNLIPLADQVATEASSSQDRDSDQTNRMIESAEQTLGIDIETGNQIQPSGSVVFSDQQLNEVDLPTANAGVLMQPIEEEASLPAYLNSTPFAKVLDTSADLTGRMNAFRTLAQAWDVQLPETLIRSACEELADAGVRCAGVSGWQALLRLNRPTILVLAHRDGLHRAILFSLRDDQARVLIGEQVYELPVNELRDRWTNQGVLFWRPGLLSGELLQLGDDKPAVQTLRELLNRAMSLVGLPVLTDQQSTLFDDALTDSVRQLQRKYNIVADGKVGNETYLLLNELLYPDNVPRLQMRGPDPESNIAQP